VDRHTLAARVERLLRGLQHRLAGAAENDAGALLEEAGGRRAADAAASAGDYEVALTPTAMSRFVDRVQAAGYVRREPDPHDRRALQITITDEGVDLLRRMWPVYARGIQAHFAPHAGPGMRAMLEGIAAGA